jgi:hypothetical protein
LNEEIELSPELQRVAVWIFTTLLFGSFLLTGWALFGLGHFVFSGAHKLVFEAEKMNGTVVEVIRESRVSDNGTRTVYVPVVEFVAKGSDQKFKFKDNFGSNRSVPAVGSSVSVLYDEDDPRVAQIDKGPFLNWLNEYVRMAVLFFSLLALKQFSARRKQLTRSKRFEGDPL